MSSIYDRGTGADKCIDGITDASSWHGLCHTSVDDPAPWLALDYGVSKVSVARVVIFDRTYCGAQNECMDRTRNVEIRLSNELPTSATSMFTGGYLLGTFAGPAYGKQIEIESGPGWAEKYGRYVIVQMDNGPDPLNLNEVTAFGGSTEGKHFILPTKLLQHELYYTHF